MDQAPAARHINSLPDLCLLAIFDRVPLQDLIDRVPQVCTIWDALAQEVAATRHNVTLYIGEDEDESFLVSDATHFMYTHEDVLNEKSSIVSLDPKSLLEYRKREEFTIDVDQIIDFLPNVTTLSVVMSQVSSLALDQVSYLMVKLSPRLLTFKLLGSFQEDDLNFHQERHFIARNIYNLLHWINSLEVLQHLSLYFTLDIAATTKIKIDLPILSRLREFRYYVCNDDALTLLRSITKYARRNEQLRNIELHSEIANPQSLQHFLTLPPELASRFTALSPDFYEFICNEAQIARFTSLFTSLRSLKLNMGTISITRLAKILSPLQQLLFIELNINFETGYRLPFSEDDEVDPSAICPLRSVKKLRIYLQSIASHSVMKSVHLGNIFPELLVFKSTVELPTCDACNDNPENAVQNCYQLLYEPWRQCPKLKRINREDISH